MRKTTVGLFSIIFLTFLFHGSVVFGQQTYDLKVVAKTGVALGTGTPAALGTGPSINDVGKVAFIARDSADPGDGRVILLNNGVIEQPKMSDDGNVIADHNFTRLGSAVILT